MAKSTFERECAVQKTALESAKEALEKAKTEYVALEEDAVKALTGEAAFPIEFTRELIPKRKAALDEA